jgi:hypothetical protein
LSGSSRGDSQEGIFALVRTGEMTVVAMIEGKVDVRASAHDLAIRQGQ